MYYITTFNIHIYSCSYGQLQIPENTIIERLDNGMLKAVKENVTFPGAFYRMIDEQNGFRAATPDEVDEVLESIYLDKLEEIKQRRLKRKSK